jgi:exodeoxyribonuclease VII small subunit
MKKEVSKKQNKETIEKMFENLERIVSKMEKENNLLEENFELYKEGCDICKALKEKVDTVEKKFIEVDK